MKPHPLVVFLCVCVCFCAAWYIAFSARPGDLFGASAHAQTDETNQPPEYPTAAKPIVVRVYDSTGAEADVTPTLLNVNGKVRVSVQQPKSRFRTGRYTLKVWMLQGNVIYFTESQFVWGVFAANFNKSIYTTHDTARVQMGVLTDDGNTVCDAGIRMLVATPGGTIIERATTNGTILRNATCGHNNVTQEPDYETNLPVAETGTYRVRTIVTNQNGTREFSDTFEAQDIPAFDIARAGPTRIYPPAPYMMQMTIHANQDFAGDVVETLPDEFMVTPTAGGRVETMPDGRVQIIWTLDLKQGDIASLGYEFDAPDISPELFKLGPLTLRTTDSSGTVDWNELRQWQVASDAVTGEGSVILYGDTADDENVNARFALPTATSTWGAEGTTLNITAETRELIHVSVKAAPTRPEYVAGHQTEGGRASFIRYSSGAWTQLFTVASSSPLQACNVTKGDCWQTFDVAYEQLSGDALMVYAKSSTLGTVFYVTWDGNATSAEQSFVIGSAGTRSMQWMQLAPRGDRLTDQRTDDIILTASDGSNRGYAAVWNGSSFIASTTLTANAEANGRFLAGAWETFSGQGVVVFASGTVASTNPFFYKTFSGGAWSANATSVGVLGSTIGVWVDMASDPISDRIGVALSSYATTATCQEWPAIWKATGTEAWTVGTGDTALENEFSKCAAVAWERYGDGATSSALWVIAQAGTGQFQYQTSSGGTFSALANTNGTFGDDATDPKLVGSPNSDMIWMAGSNVDADVETSRWLGAAWEALTASLGTNVVTSTNDGTVARENNAYDIAWSPYSPWARNWRWYSGTSTLDTPSSTPLAGQNTSASSVNPLAGQVRLRYNVIELGGNKQTDTRKVLQFTTGTDPNASSTPWTDVADVESPTAVWRYYDVSSTTAVGDDGAVLAATTLTSSTVAGWWNTNGTVLASTSMDQASTSVVEIEFPIEANSAAASTTYYFRMYDTYPTSVASRVLGTPIYRQQTSVPANPCNAAACTYPQLKTGDMPNVVPSISAASISPSPIVLTVNATTSVFVNFTVTDTNGCSDVFTSGNVTTTLFRTGVSSTCAIPSPTTSSQNCYLPVSVSNNCSGGTSANATATFNVWYFAQATDSSSSFPTQNWQGFIQARDGGNATSSTSTAVSGGSATGTVAISTTSTNDVANAVSLTTSHVVSGSDRLLLVGVETYLAGGAAIPSATYNSVSMPLVSTLVFGSSNNERISLFQLVAPDTGTHDIVVSATSTQTEITVAGISFTGVNQTTPLGTPTSTELDGVTLVSQSVSSTVEELVVDFVSWFNQAITVGANQTQRLLNDNAGGNDSIAISTEPGSTTVTMSWSWAAGEVPGHIVVPIKPVAAVAGGGVELLTLLGFDVSTSTSYGALSVGTDTGSTNQTVAAKNVGNATSTLKINGTALTSGGNLISTSSQHYATSTFTYGGFEQALQEAATAVSGFLLKAQTSTANIIQANTFWGLAVPGGTVDGSYAGTNTFTAVWSP